VRLPPAKIDPRLALITAPRRTATSREPLRRRDASDPWKAAEVQLRPFLQTAVVCLGLAAGIAGCGSAGHTEATTSTGSASTEAPGPSGSTDPTSSPLTVEPGGLPQTRDQPGVDGAAFLAGSRALWQAIVADDPAPAMPFFFPLSAYRQVKDVKDPTADWHNRLVTAFGRDIHRLHQQLGSDATQARLVGLDVPTDRATWVDPGQEHNKLGYWRVYGSLMRYEVAGTMRSMAIYSLISWRGEWYVVHVGPP